MEQLLEQNYYFLDLTKKTLETTFYPKKDLMKDLKHLELKKPKDLNSYDLKFFETEDDAEAYLNKYNKTLKSLNNKTICKSRKLPCLLYKRRYIVQTLLGEKNQTVRHYLKDFKKGDLINLHDQTYFLTVRIKSVEKLKTGEYQYNFELP